jgi:hypothetical protein
VGKLKQLLIEEEYMNRYNNDSYYEPEDELTEEELEELELELDETDFIDEDDWERDDD